MNVYLNNAATGWPRAPGVIEAMQKTLSNMPFHPGRIASENTDEITECRQRLAKMLEIKDPSRIVLTVNSTHALNLAIFGLGLDSDAHVITTVTEHNSILRPLNHLREKNSGLRLSLVGFNGGGELDEEVFSRLLKENPSLVVLNHASNVTGRIADAGRLLHMAREAGAVTLLDASQSMGIIPVCPEKLYADMVAFTGHKGLHGPPGTGGLYVSPDIELQQVYVGGTGVRSDLTLHPGHMPMRLEAGTPNVPAFAGLAAALRWHENEGSRSAVRARELISLLYEELNGIPAVTIYDNCPDVERVGVVSFTIDGWDVEEAGYILSEIFGVACRTGLHCAPLIHKAIGSAPEGTIRFSVSGFNTEEDVEIGIMAVKRLAK